MRIFWILVAVMGLSLGSPQANGQNSIGISGGGQAVQGLGSASFGIEMDNDAPVEGYVVAVSYDNSAVAITALSIGGSVTEAAGA